MCTSVSQRWIGNLFDNSHRSIMIYCCKTINFCYIHISPISISIFQAAQIKKLQSLAKEHVPDSSPIIHWSVLPPQWIRIFNSRQNFQSFWNLNCCGIYIFRYGFFLLFHRFIMTSAGTTTATKEHVQQGIVANGILTSEQVCLVILFFSSSVSVYFWLPLASVCASRVILF